MLAFPRTDNAVELFKLVEFYSRVSLQKKITHHVIEIGIEGQLANGLFERPCNGYCLVVRCTVMRGSRLQ